MKRTRLKKVSKQKISVLQRKLWAECKRIVRARDGNVCYTCGAKGLTGSNWHTGHLWAKASLPASLKYDLRVLKIQCYKCNIHYGGNGAIFYKKMVHEFGQDYMDALERERQTLVKAYDFYIKLLAEYQQIK